MKIIGFIAKKALENFYRDNHGLLNFHINRTTGEYIYDTKYKCDYDVLIKPEGLEVKNYSSNNNEKIYTLEKTSFNGKTKRVGWLITHMQ